MMVKSACLRHFTGTVVGMALILTETTCSTDRSNGIKDTAAAAAYGIMAEKSLDLLSSFDLETWGTMLSDSVVYYFPAGDAKNCRKLTGKVALLAWWKNYIGASGLKSMSIVHASYLPVYIERGVRSGDLPGTQVIAYFSNKMIYNSGTVYVKMNFMIHFDKNKLIDGYYTYYDRTPIIKVLKNRNVPVEFTMMKWMGDVHPDETLHVM